ncbi:hypothetical protein NLM27_17620 [Bradyrhizobium sp. CCGB12]|uniref:hypothetical protein n=1 Tax=Bradyrhizobium sp. CCGB12 TaxID=2949632 RepID=UPI0020B37E1B|nr:hypothetical protein [Bradyrhizobium sp. CCGB12]MCP3390600.1 hypothetical protein [Bradyrhizobium sp. CCGB12]
MNRFIAAAFFSLLAAHSVQAADSGNTVMPTGQALLTSKSASTPMRLSILLSWARQTSMSRNKRNQVYEFGGILVLDVPRATDVDAVPSYEIALHNHKGSPHA